MITFLQIVLIVVFLLFVGGLAFLLDVFSLPREGK